MHVYNNQIQTEDSFNSIEARSKKVFYSLIEESSHNNKKVTSATINVLLIKLTPLTESHIAPNNDDITSLRYCCWSIPLSLDLELLPGELWFVSLPSALVYSTSIFRRVAPYLHSALV